MAHTQAVLALRKLRREKRDCEVILGNRVNSKPASGGLPKEILSQKKKNKKPTAITKTKRETKKKGDFIYHSKRLMKTHKILRWKMISYLQFNAKYFRKKIILGTHKHSE
jgi:hypothetical protein